MPVNEPRRSPQAAVRSCRRASDARAYACEAFQLQERTARQSVCTDGAASRQSARLEIRHVDFVEVLPARHVGQHYCALKDIIKAEPCLLQDLTDVAHRLPRLVSEVRRKRAVGGDADLSGEVKDIA